MWDKLASLSLPTFLRVARIFSSSRSDEEASPFVRKRCGKRRSVSVCTRKVWGKTLRSDKLAVTWMFYLHNKKWACIGRYRPLKFPPVQTRSNDYLPATLLFS
jgi:hypothetical protein